MLRITKQTDYGILLLTHFIDRGAESEAFSARDLARKTLLPLPMVSKILKLLARSGILVSQRGVRGGYTLAREPRQIAVAHVIDALDGPVALTECQDDTRNCDQESICPMRTNWEIINSAILGVLRSISLADMNRPINESGGLLETLTLRRPRSNASRTGCGCGSGSDSRGDEKKLGAPPEL
ncbi:MAG: SUF system Fe-S cluster assembly regulator [Myxococcales bacterium]|nr:SUF system Fe-S cluster assembly regulator [Myxococcales bacterium]